MEVTCLVATATATMMRLRPGDRTGGVGWWVSTFACRGAKKVRKNTPFLGRALGSGLGGGGTRHGHRLLFIQRRASLRGDDDFDQRNDSRVREQRKKEKSPCVVRHGWRCSAPDRRAF